MRAAGGTRAPRMRAVRAIFAASLALTVAAAQAQERAPLLAPSGPAYHVDGAFRGKGGDVAHDLSGIACLPADGQMRRCLVVNDEGKHAQFAVIEQNQITPGHHFDLIGDAPSPATRGKQPNGRCPNGTGGFKEFDGEGVAYAAPFFYVAGSHGCGRHSGLLKLSSFILARVDMGPHAERYGKKNQQPETTWRLSDALASKPKLAPFFAMGLNDHNGLNVEGIAVVGDRLFAGLRAPSLSNSALLVGVPIAALFAPGDAPLAPDPLPVFQDVISLPLGVNVGIRDLAALPDGRLLVMAGPAQDQHDVPYSLHVVDPLRPDTLRTLGALPPVEGRDGPAKAEALTPLGDDHVLVLFDGVDNGGPSDYAVRLR